MTEQQIREIMHELIVSRKRNIKNKIRWQNQFSGKTKRKLNDDQIFIYCLNKINSSIQFRRLAKGVYKKYEYLKYFKQKREKQKCESSDTKWVKLDNGQLNNICWILTCYNELEFVRQAVSHTRKYDSGKIIIINDGGNEEGLLEIAKTYSAEYINSNQYKLPGKGCHWWDRFFKLGLESGCDYIVKIDPDTLFLKPLEYLIPDLDYFGTVFDHEDRSPHLVQGGIQGFSRKYIQRILNSGLMFLFPNRGNRVDGSFSTDIFMESISSSLNQLGQEWKEVWSVWGARQALGLNKDHDYSIIHPCGLIRESDNVEITIDHSDRLLKCERCDYFDLIYKTCSKCNCYIYPLTKLKNEKCPIGKW
jgi:hypothetical protein